MDLSPTPIEESSVAVTNRCSKLGRRFSELYGRKCSFISRAPGRINLIGEHTDYNDGFVMPAAINLSCWVAVSATDSRMIEVHSCNVRESRAFSLDRAQLLGDWSDYIQGVAIMLERSGYRMPGARILIWSDVPIGSGLSSSASLEVAVALALLATQTAHCDRSRVALMCQHAENELVGARCGIMDQFISSHAQAGHALMLDCRSLEHRFLPIPADARLVICNSLVKHKIAAGEYNRRRAECEEGVRLLSRSFSGIRALRDIALADLERSRDSLPPSIYKRCRHVVGENERVLAACAAFEGHDLQRVGELMAASHKSLRDDYDVSCPELDFLVDLASRTPGVYGARMTGGGFGGCTINLVSAESVTGFVEQIAFGYRKQTGLVPEIYVSEASSRADRWELTE